MNIYSNWGLRLREWRNRGSTGNKESAWGRWGLRLRGVCLRFPLPGRNCQSLGTPQHPGTPMLRCSGHIGLFASNSLQLVVDWLEHRTSVPKVPRLISQYSTNWLVHLKFSPSNCGWHSIAWGLKLLLYAVNQRALPISHGTFSRMSKLLEAGWGNQSQHCQQCYERCRKKCCPNNWGVHNRPSPEISVIRCRATS